VDGVLRAAHVQEDLLDDDDRLDARAVRREPLERGAMKAISRMSSRRSSSPRSR